MSNTPWITNAILDDAAAIAKEAANKNILDKSLADNYSDYEDHPEPLQRFIADTFTTYRAQCVDDTAAASLDELEKDFQEPAAAAALLISIEALAETPDYKNKFPIFTNPDKKINSILQGNSVLLVAREEPAQAAADPNGTDTAATGSPEAAGTPGTGNTATGTAATPVYVAIPAAYTVSGNQSTGDYMQELNALGYKFRRNAITNRIEINGQEKTDGLESEIYLAMRDRGYRGRAIIADCINVLADSNEYNPIKDYLTSLHWDGTEVLDQFVTLLNPSDPIFAGIIFRKWMIGAVAKVMNHAQNSMLVLEGEQGSGKSYFARWLCPLPKYFKEAAIQPDNKDHEIAACSKWIWEVKELNSTTRRADQDALKGFLTSQEFNYRPAYARNDITRPAIVSYIGTVNNSSGFLIDVTGNRRFWTIGTGNINWDYATLYNVNDLWAEAFARWKRGESYTLTPDESKSLAETQEQYKVVNMTAEAMEKYFDIDTNKINDPLWSLPVIDVRDHLKLHGGLSETDVNARRIGDTAKELGIFVRKEKRNGKTITVYHGIRYKNTNP